jgi:biotin operon repressor
MNTIPSYKLNQMLADLHRKGMSYGELGGLLGLSRQAVFARIDRHIICKAVEQERRVG